MIERVVLRKAYVYAILVDGVVRYIGKGTGQRMITHVRFAKQLNKRRSAGHVIKVSKFYNKLAKALLVQSKIEYNVIAKGISHSEAFDIEAIEIAKAAPEQLWNVLPGGFGFDLDNLLDVEEFYRRLHQGIEDSWQKPDRRIKHVKGALKRWESEEARTNHSEILSNAWADEELCKRHGEIFRKRFASDEELSRHNSEIAKGRWKDPEQRVKQSHTAVAMQAARAAKKNSNLFNSFLSFGG